MRLRLVEGHQQQAGSTEQEQLIEALESGIAAVRAGEITGLALILLRGVRPVCVDLAGSATHASAAPHLHSALLKAI